MWLFGNKQNHHRSELKVSSASKRMMIIISSIAVFLFFFIAWILIVFTDSDVPYWDSFTTALSFVATWMLARKILENWLIWIVVDAVTVGLYIYKDLYPSAVLFLFLTAMAFVGYKKWKMDLT